MESKMIKLPYSKFRVSPQNCKVYYKNNSKYGYVCSIILPTCNSKVFKDMFWGTVEHIKEIAPYTTICLNLQGKGFNLKEITDKFNDLGFSWCIMEGKYNLKDGCPFNRIVDDTCMLAPQNTKIFLRVDDDFIFHKKNKLQKKTAGEQYLNCIHYMLTHPKCGIIATNGLYGRVINKHQIGPLYQEYELEERTKVKCPHRDLSYFKDFVWTATGIFIRNIKSKTFNIYGRTLTTDIVEKDWTYDGEDVLTAAIRGGLGYYIARTQLNLIEHLCLYSGKMTPENDTRKWHHIWEESEFGDWVRENLNYEKDRIEYGNYIVDRELFKDRYGELLDREKCLKLRVNYRETPTKQIIEEIDKIISQVK